MREIRPLESVEQITDLYPKLHEGDEQDLTWLAFDASRHFPTKLKEKLDYLWPDETTPTAAVTKMVLESVMEIDEDGSSLGRFEASQVVARKVVCGMDSTNTVRLIETGSEDQARQAVESYCARWPASVFHRLQPSPLYPEGRRAYTELGPLDEHIARGLPYRAEVVVRFSVGSDEPVPSEILDYLKRTDTAGETTQNLVCELIERSEVVDPGLQNELRLQFGAKAANLILLDNYFKGLQSQLPEGVSMPHIPPFIPVSTDLYQAWKSDAASFEDAVQKLQKQAQALDADSELSAPRVVVVRSSAVESEDGDNITGAGIYASLAADPYDSVAFRNAIETVFQSVDSKRALDYRMQHGIEVERMGLVVQSYIEGTSGGLRDTLMYGTIDSRGYHPELVEASSEAGSLLYDRKKVFANLLDTPFSREGVAAILHTIPDHNYEELFDMARQAISPVSAAVLAERFFGKPVEIEFAGKNVVQARPLPPRQVNEQATKVEFPKHLEPAQTCRAVGVGDITLPLLDRNDNNEYNDGVVIYDTEKQFTIWDNSLAIPRSGAVIVLNNDGYSGHVQMLCREKGILCLFPDAGKGMDASEQLRQLGNDDEGTRLRLVSDGYKGAIYVMTPEMVVEEEARKALLQRVASGAAALITKVTEQTRVS